MIGVETEINITNMKLVMWLRFDHFAFRFGMAGLLTFLRTIESAPSIVGLALGHDLTNLGLNLNSSK